MMNKPFLLLCLALASISSVFAQESRYRDITPRPLLAEQHSGAIPPDFALIPQLSSDSLSTLTPAIERAFPRRAGHEVTLSLRCTDTLSFSPSAEAYRVLVSSSEVLIEGRSIRGVYNGIQTLKQLVSDSGIPCGVVEDAPAFRWRGFLADVGRNYQSVVVLKQQIDAMAGLKLNVFHFHATEDVAWRLESRLYPELNNPSTMTRDKGLFYRYEELEELRRYCEERFILFLPEIDMPGHSAAFERAMGCSMQSEKGQAIVLELLDEFLSHVDCPYLHIGADEVKIHNRNFVPAVVSFIEAKGVKAIGWSPGGNYPETVIRQLWSAAEKSEIDNPKVAKIDSRNLYINHMDPLESVVSIFYHRILDSDSDNNDEHLLGGELCLWNDRNLLYGDLNHVHNPTYPSLVAFAEKGWGGGGYVDNFVSLSQDRDFECFRDFERRLCIYGKRYMQGLPFPYIPQSEIRWSIFGPYPNGGKTAMAFPIESLSAEELESLTPDTTFIGGTLILRHFWDPQIKGLWTNPAPNQTVYAYRRVWSDEERESSLWIGFYDYSRSQWADAFPKGKWSNTDAQIWLNGETIAPPLWAHSGQKGDPEIPFWDENYTMRPPTRVTLRKGWNTLLLKIPVGSFVGSAWYAPVKWMATAVFVDDMLQ